MIKTIILLLFISISNISLYSQFYDIGDKIYSTPSNYQIIGISSKDNSKIYRYKDKFPTTVFSYTVDKYEIKIRDNTVVGMHFVLYPTDNNYNVVPESLINKIKIKSGNEPLKKGIKYYFDDGSTRTIVYRKNIPDYGGDRIFIYVVSTDYLFAN